jgi:hypothetical protein
MIRSPSPDTASSSRRHRVGRGHGVRASCSRWRRTRSPTSDQRDVRRQRREGTTRAHSSCRPTSMARTGSSQVVGPPPSGLASRSPDPCALRAGRLRARPCVEVSPSTTSTLTTRCLSRPFTPVWPGPGPPAVGCDGLACQPLVAAVPHSHPADCCRPRADDPRCMQGLPGGVSAAISAPSRSSGRRRWPGSNPHGGQRSFDGTVAPCTIGRRRPLGRAVELAARRPRGRDLGD